MSTYPKIQYDGSNADRIFEFAEPLAIEHYPNCLVIVMPDRNVTISTGDYLFKDREGKIVSVNPA